MFVFMIMGSPPVNKMSETSSCSCVACDRDDGVKRTPSTDLQIVEQRIRVLLGKSQVRVSNKLGPAEAVRAVRVARLRRRREEEDRLRVFMLYSG